MLRCDRGETGVIQEEANVREIRWQSPTTALFCSHPGLLSSCRKGHGCNRTPTIDTSEIWGITRKMGSVVKSFPNGEEDRLTVDTTKKWLSWIWQMTNEWDEHTQDCIGMPWFVVWVTQEWTPKKDSVLERLCCISMDHHRHRSSKCIRMGVHGVSHLDGTITNPIRALSEWAR